MFSFRTVTRKRIDVFSRNFAGMCMGVCCIVFDIDGMLFEFFMNFLNIEKKIIKKKCFVNIYSFLHVLCYFQHLRKKFVYKK